jgi:hypothetical protein
VLQSPKSVSCVLGYVGLYRVYIERG